MNNEDDFTYTGSRFHKQLLEYVIAELKAMDAEDMLDGYLTEFIQEIEEKQKKGIL